MGEFPNKATQFTSTNQPEGRGRPVGRRSLSTIIRDVLEEELDWSLVPIKNADEFQEKYKDRRGWDVLTHIAVSKAVMGDTRALAWLSRAGYGDKLTLDAAEGLFKTGRKLEINVVDSPTTVEQDAESSPPATE